VLRVPNLDKRQACCLKFSGKKQIGICSGRRASSSLYRQFRWRPVRRWPAFHDPRTLILFLRWIESRSTLEPSLRSSLRGCATAKNAFCMGADRTSGARVTRRYSRHDPYRKSGQDNASPIEPVASPDRFRETGWRSAPRRPREHHPRKTSKAASVGSASFIFTSFKRKPSFRSAPTVRR
jgi:hypothetical protein